MIAERDMTTPSQMATPPTFFRLCVEEARRGDPEEFEVPGYHLALNLRDCLSQSYDDDDVHGALSSLKSRLMEDHGDDVLDWFDFVFPLYTALIPRECRVDFLAGVYAAFDEDRIDF